MASTPKVEVTKEREVRTYAEMWHASECLLKKGQEDPKGSLYQVMASLVFTAFTLEAYLNHIGPKLFECWKDLERLGPKEKLNLITEQLRVNFDYSRRPWQVMKHLYGFRNDIAHGKSKVEKSCNIELLNERTDARLGDFVRTKWEKYCTEDNAIKARDDVEKIVFILYEAGQFENDYPFSFGFQFGRATLLDE